MADSVWGTVGPVLRTGAKRVLAVAVFCGAALAYGADWPQFGGPTRTNVSKETGLLAKWPEKGPPLQWTYRNAGLGFSSFAIVGNKLYTLGTRDKDEIVLALDAETGKELWTAKIGPIFTFQGNSWGDGPRGAPTIDGTRLYALGGQGMLVCVDIAAGGKEVWRKDFIKDLNGEMMSEWGYSESPLVDGDLVIASPGGGNGTVAAFNKNTGAVVWRSELKQKASYGSAVAAELNGVRQYIQSSYISDIDGATLSGFAAKDGKTLWSAPLFKGKSYSVCPTPLVVGNVVYATMFSDALTNCHAFEIGPDWQVKDLYTKVNQNKLKNNHGGVALVDGYTYGHSEGQGWVCQDFKTGKAAWLERNALEGGSGSIIAADGKLYLYSDRGEVVLLEANPKEWTETSRFTIPELSKVPDTRPTSSSSKVWTHPALANGRLYLRDHELIYCFDVRDKK